MKLNLGVYPITFYNYGTAPIDILQGAAPASGKTILEHWGERRVGLEGTSGHPGSRQMYYDIGALAIAFAINRASKSSKQFWQGADSFWYNINATSVLSSGTWSYTDSYPST